MKNIKLLLFPVFSGIIMVSVFSIKNNIVSGQNKLLPENTLKQITTDPAPDYHVKWSPDGKTLAFASWRSGDTKIWLIPSEGGDPVMLETGLSGDHHISWAPDSRYITFDARPQGSPPEIFTIALDDGEVKQLTTNRFMNFHPYWSPDGSHIAFASLRNGNIDIWIMPSTGGQATRLTHHEADDHHPVWSPDGSQIAFTSERSGNWDIWIIPASGGEARQLTFHEADDDQTSWSPDGTRIAFMSKRSGKRDIWIMSISGGDPVRFTEESDNGWPTWSPDGKRIAFSSNRAGNTDIWVKKICREVDLFKKEIPVRFDWRKKNIMTPVKHQMNLGSCGVFAAVAVFESLIKQETGKTVDLSEQQIINGSQDFVPSGISSVDAMKYIKQHGLVLEEQLPYQDRKTNEMPDTPSDYKLTDYQYVTTDKLVLSEKIKTIKQALLQYGPVATNMIFYQDLDRYKGGIYMYDGHSEEQGGHWVVIVGWEDDKKVKNGGYWICRNSWGEKWGENGYFNIAYGECGIDNFWFVYGIFKL